MALREEQEKLGNWLFRWRSYLPLLMLGIALVGMRDFTYPGNSHRWDEAWEVLCLLISFSGLGIRALVIGYVPEGTSGRNTHSQKALCLNVTGLYSVMRHPLYLGNFFIWLGISLYVRQWVLGLIFVFVFWTYYEKIIFAEEEFLRKEFGRDYEHWASTTPCILPRFSQWVSPVLPFSWRKVLKDEYSGFFAIIATFTVLEVIGDWMVEGELILDAGWRVFFLAGLAIYIVLRTMKKKGMLEPG
jgi:protein-S-isoprenylcysteine O-methyltransferase Ste14